MYRQMIERKKSRRYKIKKPNICIVTTNIGLKKFTKITPLLFLLQQWDNL